MVRCGPYPTAGPRGPLDRVAQMADRKHCRPHARPFRLMADPLAASPSWSAFQNLGGGSDDHLQYSGRPQWLTRSLGSAHKMSHSGREATMRSVIIQPMTWIKERDIEEVEPVSERDAEVLHDLREVLRRHNALARSLWDQFAAQALRH